MELLVLTLALTAVALVGQLRENVGYGPSAELA